MQRGSGVLMAISSLPGRFGVGGLGTQAYAFVDALQAAGQRYWQILPLTPVGPGASPYQSVSAFAGDCQYIDFALLQAEGMLSQQELAECEAAFRPNDGRADYEAQVARPALLEKAFRRGWKSLRHEVADFREENAHWLPQYALYLAICEEQDGALPPDWPAPLRERRPEALMAAGRRLRERVAYHEFIQYLFYRQWTALRRYANAHGVAMIGDLPFYVAPGSADIWAEPRWFDCSGNVAGCPPDYFSSQGQRWGNPLYNWQALAEDGYGWWLRRIAYSRQLYDYLRIDHFRGFEAYYAIPAAAKTAAEGAWQPGPGMALFHRLREACGELPLIAEDLGTLTDSFFAFMAESGFPGLRVLQFAFTPEADSIYLPHHAVRNSVIYTGTHDNDTVRGWFAQAAPAERAFVAEYLGPVDDGNIADVLIRTAQATVCDVCIIPMQDWLGLGSEARMNRPGTVGGDNWRWRMADDAFDHALQQRMLRMAHVFGRF